MPNVFMDVTSKQVKDLADEIRKNNPDRTLVLAQFSKIQVSAPTKRNKNHRFKIEVEIPAEAIIGESVIFESGGLMMLDIATNRIQPKYLHDEEEKA